MTLTAPPSGRPLANLSDDQLFDELREQVNRARNSKQGHNRKRTRQIADEAIARGWKPFR